MPTWAAIRQCRPIETVVCDLDEIVDLGALADDGVAGRAAVDRRIGADFDVVLNDDAPGLRDFLMSLRTRQIAEAVLADASAGMDDHAVADQSVQDRGAGADRAIAADADIGTDDRAGPDQRARRRSRRAGRSPRADRRSRRPQAAPSDALARLRRGLCCRTATTAAARRETACARPRRRPDRDAASPARPIRAAPRPQNAARSGRRRRA